MAHPPIFLWCGVLLLGSLALGPFAVADDLSRVPLWDAETLGGLGNRFGGKALVKGFDLTRVEDQRQAGREGYRARTIEPIEHGHFAFIQLELAGMSGQGETVPSRDLSHYQSLDFQLKNATGRPFVLTIEIKDYRNQNERSARYTLRIHNQPTWRDLSVPLDLQGPRWDLRGIDPGERRAFLRRARSITLLFEPLPGATLDGDIFLDEMALVEPGGPIDVETVPDRALVERLARRQWAALWGSRNHANGLIPSHSTSSDHGALNTTAAVLNMLPRAVDNGWVEPDEAMDHLRRVVATFNTVMDRSRYVPGRYLGWTTLQSDFIAEETNIDAAMLALALHRWKNRPEVPEELKQQLHELQNRFDFEAFIQETNGAEAWSIAYDTATGEMNRYSYNGYSGETWVLSLAAHLAEQHHVPITRLYHSAIQRTRERLVSQSPGHVVATLEAFRAPFLQWLFPLYVDVGERGLDTYPDRSLAVNPRANAELFQQEVHRFYAERGRGLLLQPDAGFGIDRMIYSQYGPYDDHGKPDLFMPWSAAFSLLGEPKVGVAAVRHHLLHDLETPFGLADAATWITGEDQPQSVPAFNDLWNTSLSTMALFEYLYNDAAEFSSLPEVREALDQVFLGRSRR